MPGLQVSDDVDTIDITGIDQVIFRATHAQQRDVVGPDFMRGTIIVEHQFTVTEAGQLPAVLLDGNNIGEEITFISGLIRQ
ncbi:hypothetical protein ALP17_200020 [Pseudomonas savastanoi]|uniref:Uncharacterized protein n=1 Tax=Pseudomonas savastanoi TaxID=29438 RepID=A0A3M6APG3_PSESS|nr:hypothetical protein ALP17_200020 [Pseudomonas savastanoi]